MRPIIRWVGLGMLSEEEYRNAVIRIAQLMPEFIDEMKRLRGAIDRMPRGRL